MTMASWWAVIVLLMISSCPSILGEIGINYGTVADNLPDVTSVVALLNEYNVDRIRIFQPNPDIQRAIEAGGTCISVTLGVANEDIQGLAASPDVATQWVLDNIGPFNPTCISYLTVGNEVVPGPLADYVAPAMQNLRNALQQIGASNILVSTVVAADALAMTYPPSAGAFKDEAAGPMQAILADLDTHPDTKLLINVYPYFAYASDPVNVGLDYALFTATGPVVTDGQYEYWNLFDAMVDAFYAAMERAGFARVGVIVSESGWPSAGNGEKTTPALAQTYNTKLRERVNNNAGTPRRPNEPVFAFVFALFNENQKPAGVEQNWGLYYPDQSPVYPFWQLF